MGDSARAIVIQTDGKIVIGGKFSTLCGVARSNLGRVNSNGSLDAAFSLGASGSSFFPGVGCLALQADGKILVGGGFSSLGGQTRTGIARINADGTLDLDFNPSPGGVQDPFWGPIVNSIAPQADGRILLSGEFTMFGGQSCYYVGRLSGNGTLDTGFNAGATESCSVALQPDGKILLGGSFTAIGGQSRRSLARLNNTSPATQSLAFNSSSVTWLRGGTGPEVWRTTFEASANGSGRFSLGAGGRIPGGWQLSGFSLPNKATIRARGFYSLGFVESYAGLPLLSQQPVSQTNMAGALASFSARAFGSEPLAFQWRRNGTNLANAGNISGADTATLAVSNLLRTDAASYSVIVSNTFGSVTSAVASLTVLDPAILSQPADQAASPGGSAQFTVTAVGTPQLRYQWRKNDADLVGATASSLALSNLQFSDAASAYSVVVTNPVGGATSSVAFLTMLSPLAPDSVNPSMNQFIRCMAVQADGRILLGGDFTTLCDQPRNRIGRLNPDGTLDTNFAHSANGSVNALAVQTDGKILLVGYFTGGIRRLKANGDLDPDFNAPGANQMVNCLAIQPDGKILLGGFFTSLGGVPRNFLARLNGDGTLDASFNPGVTGGPATSGVGYAAGVHCISVQPDGKILVGGLFSTLGGQVRTSLGRLNADGTPDLSFTSGADSVVYALGLQADGKIVVGGMFWMLGGEYHYYVGRLHADGSIDTAFNPSASVSGGSAYAVTSLALQTDGRIVIRGAFNALCGQPRQGIGRLNSDGTLDPTFDSVSVGSWAGGLCVQPDGNILVGAGFRTADGQVRTNLGRLRNTGPAIQRLTYDGTSILWQRGGTSPEVWRTTFEVSTNGTTWLALGDGERVANGWRKSGVTLPANAITLRARGFVSGGGAGGSSRFVESLLNTPNAPVITVQPTSQTNEVGVTAAFGVAAIGPAPLSYQWRFNGTNLTDTPRIIGVNSTLLTLRDLQLSDAGNYSVVVTNGAGAVTSSVAVLTVLPKPLKILNNSLFRTNGQFGFTLSGEAGRICEIWASTNLPQFQLLLRLTNSAGTVQFTDPQTNLLRRFYQVRQP
ncbi:MAG TPA: immunoglobulin domain-containing protein [Verrucomicrobiae bacterium]